MSGKYRYLNGTNAPNATYIEMKRIASRPRPCIHSSIISTYSKVADMKPKQHSHLILSRRLDNNYLFMCVWIGVRTSGQYTRVYTSRCGFDVHSTLMCVLFILCLRRKRPTTSTLSLFICFWHIKTGFVCPIERFVWTESTKINIETNWSPSLV